MIGNSANTRLARILTTIDHPHFFTENH